MNTPPEPTEQQLPKKNRFIVLPYANKKTEDFGRRLNKLVRDNYEQVDFNIAFKSPRTIGTLFPFKDKVAADKHKSLVVYKIT